MCTIHVRIGHDDDLVVAQLGNIKIIVDSGTERSNHSFDLCIGINFVQSGLLYV